MSAPITWRNVSGTGNGEAAQILEGSRRTINNSFDIFNNVLQQRNAAAAEQATQLQDTNKQNYLDALQGAKSPEELAALQQSGQLQQLQAVLSPQARAAVRGQDEARLVNLRDQVTKRLAFEDAQIDHEQRPLRDQILTLGATGDIAGARALLAQNPQLRNQAGVAETLLRAEREGTKFDWEKERQKWAAADEAQKEKLRPLELTAKQVGIDASRQAIAASKAQVTASEEQRLTAIEQRDQLRAAAKAAGEADLLNKSGNIYASGVFNPNDTGELMKLMKDSGIGDDAGERTAIIERLSKLRDFKIKFVDPATGKQVERAVPIPMSLAKEAILGSKEGMFNWWNQGWANSMEKNLQERMAETVMMNQGGKEVAVPKVAFDFDAYLASRNRMAENPVIPGNTSKRK